MADKLITEAREAYEAGLAADQHNRDEAVKDLKFLAGEQWDADIQKERARTGRPCFVFNRLPQYERQVTGDMRLNPPAITVRPVDSGADPKTAKTITGLIRNIEAQSDGQAAYLNGATNAVRCGEGWFGITYDYVEDAFEMELAFRRIPSPLAVVCDPGATAVHRGDADWAFVTDLIPVETYKAQYPEASLTGWDDPGQWGQWRDGDFVRVAEWWRRKPIKRKLILLTSGAVVDATRMKDDAIRHAVALGGGAVRERMADGHKVCMYRMSGMEILSEEYEWPGRYIPLIRVGGDEIHVGDRVVRYGMVRFAREPQMLYNIQRTAMAEGIAMAPKAKWIGSIKQFAGLEAQWGTANSSNRAFLSYNPDEKAPGPPQRVAPDMPAMGLLQDAMAAGQDIEATIGVYRESLGKESNAVSGKAILSRQREGDVGTYVYMDNLAQAVTQAGRILIDVLPKVYDTPRTVRVLGEDGKEEFVPLNSVDPMTGEKVNDISVGRYDVVASVGPSFSTRREEARESMMNFISAVPTAAQVAGDLIAEAMDWPGSEGIAQRLRQIAVAGGVAEPKEGDPPPKQQPPPPEAMLAMAEMEKAKASMAKVQSDEKIKMAEAQINMGKLALQAQQLKIDAHKVGADIRIDEETLKLKGIEVAAGIGKDIAGSEMERRKLAMDHAHKIADRDLRSQPQEMPRPG